MPKLRLLALSPLLLFFLACDGNTVAPDGRTGPGSASASIFDAATQESDAIGFWWLPSLVPQPNLSGTFQPNLDPMIRVICYESTQGVQNCDGKTAGTTASNQIAQFTVGTGVLVGADHYKVEFDTKAYNLAVSQSSALYTTYRIIAYTSPLTAPFGGPFALGWADIQIAANGAAATNLDVPGELIALVDNRTLPVRFYINEDAYPYALASAGEDGLCPVNCSLTFIEPAETTIAELLSVKHPGGQHAALEFLPGHVKVLSALLLDELTPALCAEVGLEQRNCVRAELSPKPTGEFAADDGGSGVRMGLSRCDVPVGLGTAYAIGKYNPFEGLTRPDEIFVGDFFNDNCNEPGLTFLGLEVGRFARAIADLLIRPAYAGDLQDAGVTIRTLSDVFWMKDAQLLPISPLTVSGTVPAGTDSIKVKVANFHSHHPHPLAGLKDMEVVFKVAGGAGSLLDNGIPVDELTRYTDEHGFITVEWALGEGLNVLTADAPLALSDPEPLEFIRNATIDEQAGSGLLFAVDLVNYSLGVGVEYLATITNYNTAPESGLTIQGWVQSPTARSGGHANNGCNTVDGATAAGPGVCTTGRTVNISRSLGTGLATAVFQLRRGGTLLAEVRKEIVLQ
jgi:hypothetical protein